MTRNTELAERTIQYIEDNPTEWVQGSYGTSMGCGTVGCFAFHATRLSGKYQHRIDCVWWDSARSSAIDSSSSAIKVLGLTTAEASALFASGNSKDMLRLMVKDFVNGDEIRSWSAYYNEARE
jgi:hypothetical protein